MVVRWARSAAVWATVCGLVLAALPASADEREILNAVQRQLAEKPTSARETLISGVYGLYFPGSEQIGPRAFADRKLSVFGNSATGYAHLSGPRRGQDLSAEESQALYRDMLANLPKERLITYRFGDGARQVLLFTAYDCPTCRAVERNLQQQAQHLNATVYLIPTALRYESDPASRMPLQTLLCAPDREMAWQSLILKGQAPAAARCAEQADDYAYLARAFPVKFPRSVPTAVTLADGRIYQGVQQQFSEIFGRR